MNPSSPLTLDAAQARFGARVASRLSDATEDLPHDVAERLRAARVRAVAQRRLAAAPSMPVLVTGQAGGALALGGGWDAGWAGGLARWVLSALPLIALAVGLFVIEVAHRERLASEVAEIDAALLTDDLPPSAYADPGFAQFLKAARAPQR